MEDCMQFVCLFVCLFVCNKPKSVIEQRSEHAFVLREARIIFVVV